MEGFPPSVDDLATALHEFVNFDSVHERDSTSDVDMLNKSGGSEVTCYQNCLRRYVSFPSPANMISDYSSSDKEDEATKMTSEKLIFHEPVRPVKLVSAMKGSREKQGFPSEKLHVTWAPNVYDPTPTSVSHAGQRGTRQQKLSRKDKRRSKKVNKGKDLSRGDGGKDKKKKKKKKRSSQTTGIPGTSYNGNNDLETNSEIVENFGFGMPDSCGSSSSSFFKLSMTNAHYPVAEAL